MAYIQDSTQTFTISLIGLLEGFGNLIWINVRNVTKAINYLWTPTGWDPSQPEATEADTIQIQTRVENQGATADYMWVEFSSAQVTVSQPLVETSTPIDVGAGWTWSYWQFAMPATNVSVTIKAGHIE